MMKQQESASSTTGGTSTDTNAAAAVPVPCPDRSEDPEGWLAHRKASWRALRARLKLEKQALARRGGSSSSSSSLALGSSSAASGGDLTLEGPKRGLGVGDLLANASKQISHGTWQVLEVYNSGAPGEFVVWALTSAKTLQRIPIEVSKTLFLNSKVDHSDALQSLTKHFGARRVTHWALPRAKTVHHLYELNVPERRYQRNRKLLQSLASDQSVEGVYETSTPALFRAVSAHVLELPLTDERTALFLSVHPYSSPYPEFAGVLFTYTYPLAHMYFPNPTPGPQIGLHREPRRRSPIRRSRFGESASALDPAAAAARVREWRGRGQCCQRPPPSQLI